LANPHLLLTVDLILALTTREREEELTRRTLVLLNEMRIKFPGKTDDEAEWILNSLQVTSRVRRTLNG
jgi:hypothetical protein